MFYIVVDKISCEFIQNRMKLYSFNEYLVNSFRIASKFIQNEVIFISEYLVNSLNEIRFPKINGELDFQFSKVEYEGLHTFQSRM